MTARLVSLCAAVVLGLFGAMMLTSPAHATSKLEQSAELTADCGEVTLTFVNNHDHATLDFVYTWNIQTSDGQNYNVDVANSESPVTEVVLFAPGEDDGWVSYGVVSGPESDYYLANKTKVVTLCEPTPSPSPEPSPSPSPEPTPTPTVTPSADLNCEDFATQADAQAALDADPADPHQLDGDKDGKACDDLSSTGTGGDLPLTGSNIPVVAGAGAILAGLGVGMLLLAKRRKLDLTDEIAE